MVVGPRHYDQVMHEQLKLIDRDSSWKNGNTIQGFIDQYGVFMDRKEAWIVATNAGQIIKRVGGDGEELYSENLY